MDLAPRPRTSGDIGLIAAASALVSLSPISMAVASPYVSSPLRMIDLSPEGRCRSGSETPKVSRVNRASGLSPASILLPMTGTRPTSCWPFFLDLNARLSVRQYPRTEAASPKGGFFYGSIRSPANGFASTSEWAVLVIDD